MGHLRPRLGLPNLVDMKRLEPMGPGHDQDALNTGAEQRVVRGTYARHSGGACVGSTFQSTPTTGPSRHP
jgi:hypothetical protein